ncbi:MAG: PD40 domain-containing protein [Planctomycetes bacterium]|nr:PD40 domain-containing protein [Planctomycetota bacterium]
MKHFTSALAAILLAGCAGEEPAPGPGEPAETERHLRNVTQLTFGGENAEAYFSADDRFLILQSSHGGLKADQIFIMPAAGGDMRMVSTGKGKCTCSFFFPDGKRILYSSTHRMGDEPPPKPDHSKGYVWAVHDEFDIYVANVDGSGIERLTTNDRYDAEATISADGQWIVFTSHRKGDLDLYKMRVDGSEFTRLTTEPGYDGGAFFSPDGTKIVYRAMHPEGAGLEDYRSLLREGKVRPNSMELWVMDSWGKKARQIATLGGANFGPYWHPDGRRIIFASNMRDPRSHNFDLFLINEDGTGLERVTTHETFDGFPMFSRDGKRLVFASNRDARVRGETNIFIADWIE